MPVKKKTEVADLAIDSQKAKRSFRTAEERIAEVDRKIQFHQKKKAKIGTGQRFRERIKAGQKNQPSACTLGRRQQSRDVVGNHTAVRDSFRKVGLHGAQSSVSDSNGMKHQNRMLAWNSRRAQTNPP